MKKFQPIYVAFIALLFLVAFSSNPPDARTGAPGESNCTACHIPNNSGFEGMVNLRGMPEEIIPGVTYNLEVVTRFTTGSPSQSGFQMVLLDGTGDSAGTFSNEGANSDTKSFENRTYFKHRPAQPFGTADSVVWTVDWTAPDNIAFDSIRLYLNAIIGNGSGDSGDLMVSQQTAFGFRAPEPLQIDTLIGTDVSCFGDMNGAARVEISGGVPPFSFEWSNGVMNDTINNLGIGRYLVTVSDSDGATETGAVTINQPDSLILQFDSLQIATCDQMGSAVANVTGGTMPYNYAWDDGSTGRTASLSAGEHSITVTDANGCSVIGRVTIMEDMRLPTAFAGLDVTVTCADSNSSSVVLDAFNTSTGTGVEYLWTTTDGNIVSGDTTLMPEVDATGTYILIVTNTANGCAAEDSVSVTFDTNLPMVNAGADREFDCDSTQLILAGTGDQGENIVYEWTTANGLILEKASSLQTVIGSGGMYILTITDTITACSASDTVIVTGTGDRPLADAGMSSMITCLSDTILLNGSGTMGDSVSYQWTTADGNILMGDTTLTPIVNQPGIYTLTVTNNNTGCQAMSQVEVTDGRAALMVNAVVMDSITCNRSVVSLMTTGNTDNLTFNWTTTDGNFATDSTMSTVRVDAAGTYTLLVTDTLTGCTDTSTVTVIAATDPPPANAGISAQLTCEQPEVMLTGGGLIAPSVVYEWTTANGNIVADTNTLTPLVNAPGIYVLTITDTITGCFAQDSIEIFSDMELPEVSLPDNLVLDCQTSALQIEATASTGSVITYQWTTDDGTFVGATDQINAQVSTAGTYTLTVGDGVNACFTSDSVTVIQATNPVANAGMDQMLDCGTGSLLLQGSANDSTVTYQWTDASGALLDTNSVEVMINTAGLYILTVTDTITGCTGTDSVMITDAPDNNLFAAAGDAEQLTCAIGSVILNGNGSQGENIVYEWTSETGNVVAGQNTLSIEVNAPGRYTLTVRDTTTGCFASSFTTVNQDEVLPVAEAGDSLQLDCASPVAVLQGSSDMEFHIAYQWTTTNGNIVTNAMTPQPTIDAPGIYYLTITDTITACSGVDSVVVLQDDNAPVANAGPDLAINCNQDTVQLTPMVESSLNQQFTWSTMTGTFVEGTDTSLTPLVIAGGAYTLTVMDTMSGCTSTDEVVVTFDKVKPMAEVAADTLSFCEGTTLEVTATASQGSQYTYFWCTDDGSILDGAQNDTAIINGGGLFEFIVTDDNNGCTESDTLIINTLEGIELVLDSTFNGGAAVAVTGGAAPYTFQWNTDSMDATSTISNIPTGDYRVTATDNNGCTDSLQVSIELSTGIDDLQAEIKNLNLFPNPARTYVNITAQFRESLAGKLIIINQVGQRLWEQDFIGNNIEEQISVANWSEGLYFLTIQTDKGIKTLEISVVR